MNKPHPPLERPVELSIIVVAYNNPRLLRATLTSVQRAAVNILHEVIVVDNGSSDIMWDEIQAESPGISVLRSESNRGFAAANNLALRRSRGRFILLLNPDTLVPQDALTALVDWMEQHSQVGAAGPRLVQVDGKPQPYSFGSAPSPSYLMRRLVARALGRYLHDWDGTQPLLVDWVAGTCLIVRRSAMEQVGLLDERFFLYFEDVDWGLRFRRAGWQVMFVPTICITHIGGGSVGQAASLHYDRSLVRWYAKYYGHWMGLLAWLGLRLYRYGWRLYRRVKRGLPG